MATSRFKQSRAERSLKGQSLNCMAPVWCRITTPRVSSLTWAAWAPPKAPPATQSPSHARTALWLDAAPNIHTAPTQLIDAACIGVWRLARPPHSLLAHWWDDWQIEPHDLQQWKHDSVAALHRHSW